MRQTIDNLSSQLAQTGKLNKTSLESFIDDLGGYYSLSYDRFNQLTPFRKYQVNAENFAVANKCL